MEKRVYHECFYVIKKEKNNKKNSSLILYIYIKGRKRNFRNKLLERFLWILQYFQIYLHLKEKMRNISERSEYTHVCTVKK